MALFSGNAKVTVTITLPDGRELKANQSVDCSDWTIQQFRDFQVAQTTKRVMKGLLNNWDQLLRALP